tara:strand:+ start:429 stop:809 length:381 start_codon:yes stop_codon:yes gene_type:complete
MIKKNKALNRRSFLIGSSIMASGVSLVLAKNSANRSHVVILGGGWGGLSAAKTLRSLNKYCKITLIEKEKNFISCPISNWVVGQIKSMQDISFSYDKFKKNNNIEVIFEKVSSIDVTKKKKFIQII